MSNAFKNILAGFLLDVSSYFPFKFYMLCNFTDRKPAVCYNHHNRYPTRIQALLLLKYSTIRVKSKLKGWLNIKITERITRTHLEYPTISLPLKSWIIIKRYSYAVVQKE